MVTNMGVQKCSRAAPYYKDLTAYTLRKLNLANVDMYLDGGHAGWLGWDANIGPAATLFAEVYKAAGSPRAVRGIVTNVSNYNAFKVGSCPAITSPNVNCDEERFIKAFAPFCRPKASQRASSLMLDGQASSQQASRHGAIGATFKVPASVLVPRSIPATRSWMHSSGSSPVVK